uniref:Uncharacterized protein n=1 Tax=viral metagenome TaxID=1070528 RepID=A0A6H2A1H9_9ZZZZ
MRMTKAEQKGYQWLLSQGWAEKDITFQPKRNPDFLLSDGSAVEVKVLKGHTLVLTPKQVEEFSKMPKLSIAIFNEGSEPTAVIPYEEIKEREYRGNIRLVTIAPGYAQIVLTRDVYKAVECEMLPRESFSKCIERLLKFVATARGAMFEAGLYPVISRKQERDNE